jgi:multisubunit Na+/H+ antiporter MnhB subunit
MKRFVAGLVIGVFTLFMFLIVSGLVFGSPAYSDMDQYFIDHGQEQVAANNIVTSVVFDYRGFDTLGESAVLFTAVVGVALIFRRLEGEERP